MAPLLTKNFALLKKEIGRHVEEDRVVQVVYWTGESGCFIGCLSHGEDTLVIEQTYGLPVMVQRIAESIFEGLPAKESVAFFAALPEVVACDGKDLSRVGWQFMAAELRSLPTQDDIQAVIDPIIAGLHLLTNDTEWAKNVAASAVARAAACAAACAADIVAARRRQRDLLLQLIKDAPVF